MPLRIVCYTCQEAGLLECEREETPAGCCRSCRQNKEVVCRWPVIAASIDDRTSSNCEGPPPRLRSSTVVQNFWKDERCRLYFDNDEEIRSLAFRTSSDAPDYQVRAIEAVFQIIQAINAPTLEISALNNVSKVYKPVYETFREPILGDDQRFIGITLAWVNVFERFVNAVENRSRYQHLHFLRRLTHSSTSAREIRRCGFESRALPCVVIKSLIYHTTVGSTFAFQYVSDNGIKFSYVEELISRLSATGGSHCCKRQDSFHQVPLNLFRYIYEICWIRSERNLRELSQEDRTRLLNMRNGLQDWSFLDTRGENTHSMPMTELYRRTCLLLLEKFLRPEMTCRDAYSLFQYCLEALDALNSERQTTPAITWPLLVLFFATTPENRNSFRNHFQRFEQFAVSRRAQQLTKSLDSIAQRKTQQSGEDGLFNMLLRSDFEDLPRFIIS